jgi:glycosyltransferase involved in cell wall biosynthesis
MDSALVSIIVPIYNTEEYVEECIQSILSQSYKNIELILVNDGSTDGSGEICKKYEHLPLVRYIEIENAGVVVARKRGVEDARGEWIMFVDSDDYLLKDCVLELLSISEGVDIVIGCHTRSK